jgi:hypothetical protein
MMKNEDEKKKEGGYDERWRLKKMEKQEKWSE